MNKNFQMTQRDLNLLKMLHEFSLMSTDQIAKNLFAGVAKTTVLRRLRILCSEKLIYYIEYRKGRERVWIITRQGAWKINAEVPKKNYSLNILDHDVKLVGLRILFSKHEFIKTWIPEHILRAKIIEKHGIDHSRRRVIPDAIITFEKESISYAMGLELELHFKEMSRYRNLFWNYQQKSNVTFVWYVVTSKGLGKHLERIWNKQKLQAGGPMFIWSLHADVLKNELNAEINFGGKIYLLESLFKKKDNPSDAHAVSTLSEQDIIENKNLSDEFYSPIIEKAS